MQVNTHYYKINHHRLVIFIKDLNNIFAIEVNV